MTRLLLAALLAALLALCACGPRRSQRGYLLVSRGQPQRVVTNDCARQCEQLYWTCKASQGYGFENQLAGDIINCNPARRECYDGCPRIGWEWWR